MALEKFDISQASEIKDYYFSHGYVIVRQAIASSKINQLLKLVNQKKHDKFFVFNSQDTHVPTQPRLTAEGFIENSMLNPADLTFAPKLSRCVQSCLVDKNVADILSTLSGDTSHVMLQNMLFDKSTGTIEHQDHYYLDANPAGNMIAAWYALEDIHEDAGCFFVLPGSHKGRVISREDAKQFANHDDYRKEILSLIETSDFEYRAFPLAKGDVLFWHPYTIHGAYKNVNPQYSRKSLTAHFHPASMSSLYASKKPGRRLSKNKQIFFEGSLTKPYVESTKLYLRFVANALRGRKPEMVMRRENYEEAT